MFEFDEISVGKSTEQSKSGHASDIFEMSSLLCHVPKCHQLIMNLKNVCNKIY